jgi:phage regulator Rha-like protein
MQLKDKIFTIRNKQVMLDRDLADLYDVETRYLNKAVKRNIERFPENFCFQLTEKELNEWKFQFGTSNKVKMGLRKLPFVFTEQGVSMLAGVLRSKTAINVSIKIINAFVEMRHFLLQNANILNKFQQIDQKLITHDKQLNQIFQAIERKQITPKQGIFFDGQMYDASKFLLKLIGEAKKEIIIIDNYIDVIKNINFWHTGNFISS